MTLAWALLILRVAVGLTLVAHGTQKLFGWFGGSGVVKLARGFAARGFAPAWLWVALVIVGEVGGGLSLAFGFLTPLGAAGALGAMAMAASTHVKHGFFNSKGGLEYPLALLAMSLAVGIAGPGAYSLDGLFKIVLPVQVFLALAGAALLVDAIGIFITRSASVASAGRHPGAAA